MAIKTHKEVKEEFDRTGTSVAEWARKHRFTYSSVCDVLHNRNKGKRGEGHCIAVALGLKEGSVTAEKKSHRPSTEKSK
jgi:gp16 family phage-associated protein